MVILKGLATQRAEASYLRYGYMTALTGSKQMQQSMGNSGGPLIDLETGKVLGVNSMALEDTEGLNFAVPAKPICKILEIIKSGGTPLPPHSNLLC